MDSLVPLPSLKENKPTWLRPPKCRGAPLSGKHRDVLRVERGMMLASAGGEMASSLCALGRVTLLA